MIDIPIHGGPQDGGEMPTIPPKATGVYEADNKKFKAYQLHVLKLSGRYRYFWLHRSLDATAFITLMLGELSKQKIDG